MIAIVFPGQGSQKPGMGRSLYEASPEAKAVLDGLADALGVDLKALLFETDEETLRQTQNAQLALYTVGQMAWAALKPRLTEEVAFAGHSVGEYAALAAAGVFEIEEGARLVQTRGRLMAEAGTKAPGTMAAVLGLDRALLDEACREAEGIVVVANDNCPGQLVISGEVEAVGKAGEGAKAKGAKRVIPLNVSGAFHSPLMDEAARQMAVALGETKLGAPTGTVYANVTAEPVANVAAWPSLLEQQLKSPVRWTETVQHMRAAGIDTFIECGPGNVLQGLLRKIDGEAKGYGAGEMEELEKTVEGLRG
ncbi:[acyl-carrier-protein] S-malonyltransferase [bacterium]|nr:MAG: [acyl-carrier-protein] S-malonyltransferase [bacterium]